MLSPYSKGLFRRAISQCGVALSPWALQKNPMALTKKVSTSHVGRTFSLTSTETSTKPLCADRQEGGLLEERRRRDVDLPEDERPQRSHHGWEDRPVAAPGEG